MTTQIRQQNGISILEPSGKIVGHSVSELREAILPQIAASDKPRILINFEKVSMIDSSGLGTLMEARTAATRKNGRMGAIYVGRHIKNLVVLSRVVHIFEHFDSEEDAISALSA
ncbi:MAG: STAS domain-containing protein [Candidatus Poribacteria bacterium]|nr:STAS domain-containing protein [Candidatus Poribacteria bacterium]